MLLTGRARKVWLFQCAPEIGASGEFAISLRTFRVRWFLSVCAQGRNLSEELGADPVGVRSPHFPSSFNVRPRSETSGGQGFNAEVGVFRHVSICARGWRSQAKMRMRVRRFTRLTFQCAPKVEDLGRGTGIVERGAAAEVSMCARGQRPGVEACTE